MANTKELITKVLEECTRHQQHGGNDAVGKHVVDQQVANNPDYDNVIYKQCPHCKKGQPVLFDTCLVCHKDVNAKVLMYGDKIHTIGQLRELIADLSDDDILCIESCDDEGNAQDLFPMYVDVIDGIELLDGSVVNEVRFCQMPNVQPEPELREYDDFINDEELQNSNQ